MCLDWLRIDVGWRFNNYLSITCGPAAVSGHQPEPHCHQSQIGMHCMLRIGVQNGQIQRWSLIFKRSFHFLISPPSPRTTHKTHPGRNIMSTQRWAQ